MAGAVAEVDAGGAAGGTGDAATGAVRITRSRKMPRSHRIPSHLAS